MSEPLLEQAIEAWLPAARRQIVPLFPSPLEASFQADYAASRLLALRVGSVVGTLIGILMVPALWRLIPDAHAAILWLWCLGAMPICMLSVLALWARLPVPAQEAQIAVSGIVVAGCFTALMVGTKMPVTSIYVAGMLLLIMLEVVAAGFRFPVASGYGAILTAIFAFGLTRMATLDPLLAAILLMMMAMCTIFALFGCWRVETETRHSYARMLREKLQQAALSVRNAELDELALRDPLTGLANRRAYQAWQNGPWKTAEDAGMQVGLVMVDIDHFKKFNDFYGHPAGDACLQAVARCMADHLRGTTDLVARLGGEEFAILLPGAGLAVAGDIAERLRMVIEAMDVPHAGCGLGAAVTISCGASATLAHAGSSLIELSGAADQALYEAKQAGRNRVCLAEQRLGASAATQSDPVPQS